MTEAEWVEQIASRLRSAALHLESGIDVRTRFRLPYRYEASEYHEGEAVTEHSEFETDLVVGETFAPGVWTPRVVIEAKLGSVTTHDAITYSYKAAAHKSVHPYLRYGIMVGALHPLPGRLIRHGAHFDFMLVFRDDEPSQEEWKRFSELVCEEIKASRTLQKLVYDNRSANRDRHAILHRRLVID
jgi:hypothetical protein